MNYFNIYNSLIKSRKDRSKISGLYYELHHIIPVCMGGSDKKSNLVFLTAKEHYIAHLLLYFIYPENISILRSFCLMSSRFKSSGRIYEDAKLKRNATMPKKEAHSCWGKKRPDAAKRMTENNPMKNNWNKVKVSMQLSGRKLPIETRNKMGKKRIGVNNNKYKPIKSKNINTGELLIMGVSETANFFKVDKGLIQSRVNNITNGYKLKDWVFTYAEIK